MFLFLAILIVCVLVVSSPTCEGRKWSKLLQRFAKARVPTPPPVSHPHTLPPVSDPNSPPKLGGCNVIANVMDQNDKDGITWDHNKKRIQVASGAQPGQPGASNMDGLVILYYYYIYKYN